jgi:alpha-tubulin suppressor-like RCC1 family protein
MRGRSLDLFTWVVCVVGLNCAGAPAPSVKPVQGASEAPVAASGAAEPVTASGNVAQVACGDYHTCALLKDGTIKCWGRNKGGQVGAGSPDEQHDPIAVPGLSGIQQIATASTFSCALLADGTVKCWGSGRLSGDARFREKAPPTTVQGVADAKAIAAGGYLACALLRSGKARCWGLDPKKVQPEASDVSEVGVAGAHVCARTKKGSSACWGEGSLVGIPPPVSNARQIATGDSFACALGAEGKVRCWGSNDEGQLGTEPDLDLHKAAIEVPGVDGAARIVAGQTQACALKTDGSVRCWGSNTQGELGIGKQSTDERAADVKGLTGVADLCMASMHACARTEAGAVYCWGGNVAGQIGDGSEQRRLLPTRLKL